MAQAYVSTITRGLGCILAMILVPLLTGVVGTGARMASGMRTDTAPPAFTGALPAPPSHNAGKRTAVIIAANSGTEGSDFLAPYEVLARSGAFNLYAVAPERRITHLFPGSPMLRGVDFVPHYSFAGYDAAIGGDPDLIVIPFLPFEQAPEYQQIMSWIRAHAGPQTILLSICAGAKNLADTGLLAGRSATTHHYTFPVIARSHPDVRLVRGVRYVEDGNLISSAGVTAGVDATLFALKRVLGPEAAIDVARQLSYPYARFLDDPRYEPPAAGLSDVVGLAPPLTNMFLSGYRAGTSQLGVALYPRISEIALASVVDTYPHENTLTVNTVAPERSVVLSQHGLALIPRWSFADAPALDRIILPGSVGGDAAAAFDRWAAQRSQPTVERIHEGGGYVYDITFTDMARRAGRAVGNETLYLLEYPIGRVPAGAPLYPPALIFRVAMLALLGLALGIVIDRRRAARGERQAARTMKPAGAS